MVGIAENDTERLVGTRRIRRGFLRGNAVDVFDERTGAVDDTQIGMLPFQIGEHLLNGKRHAVGTDDDDAHSVARTRKQGGNVMLRHGGDAAFGKLLNDGGIVNELTEGGDDRCRMLL